MKFFILFYYFLLIAISKPTFGYYMSGGLLQRINMVNKDKEEFTIEVINDEKEEIICDIEYGYIKMRSDGTVTLDKVENLTDFPLKGPIVTDPILPESRGPIKLTIDKANCKSLDPCMTFGVLVTKRYKPVKFHATESVNTGLQIVQNYLFQVLVQLKRVDLGKMQITNLNLREDKLEVDIQNLSQQVAEPDMTIFFSKGKEKVKEPLTRRTRIFPNTLRHLEIKLPESGIDTMQLFIDDPNFEMIIEEVKK